MSVWSVWSSPSVEVCAALKRVQRRFKKHLLHRCNKLPYEQRLSKIQLQAKLYHDVLLTHRCIHRLVKILPDTTRYN